MERKRATSTKMLALRIGQLKAADDSAPRLSDHISPNLLEDSTRDIKKKEEHKIPLHPIELESQNIWLNLSQ